MTHSQSTEELRAYALNQLPKSWAVCVTLLIRDLDKAVADREHALETCKGMVQQRDTAVTQLAELEVHHKEDHDNAFAAMSKVEGQRDTLVSIMSVIAQRARRIGRLRALLDEIRVLADATLKKVQEK
ncbi:hypothetical protein [Silvimonas sp.]|uniref:hypothetical protein n=1 Tax=Silvimonas sp. TaxID=2650811 RepID=UPI0028520FAC|nr:hypothetical protein [Silvimonas sp.]MDR3427789.1 hypothetical protein [Silvimonas sp.]